MQCKFDVLGELGPCILVAMAAMGGGYLGHSGGHMIVLENYGY